MLREIIVFISFIILLTCMIGSFLFVEKSVEKQPQEIQKVIEFANESE